MADYLYLLEHQLSEAQRFALGKVREVARGKGMTLFLTGGAVRDLTYGASIRDLDVTVQGDARSLRKELELAGAVSQGENEAANSLYLQFPGGVRVEVAAAHTVAFPKPGKPVYTPANILDDLRHRDFTANAMAISLNEGSYGLLMDPMNGAADIENREFRLVSNYGFIEDPSRLVRVARYIARSGWQMEEKTKGRYDTAKEEGYISALPSWNAGYELEEIAHEDDPVRILRALESEGWMKSLFPAWTAAKVNANALTDLQTKNGQLQDQKILAFPAAIQFPLLTAKLTPADATALKKKFPRQGFVREIADFERRTRDLQTKLLAKENAAPSATWKLLHTSDPADVLSLYFTTKTASVQNRFKIFLTESPTARQRLPYTTLTEMRITPDLPVYNELLDKLFFELMDNRLSAPEELKAFLEPYSPPAPPPPVNLRRPRAKKEAKAPRAKAKKAAKEQAAEGESAAEPMSLPTEVADVPIGSAPARDGGEPKPAKKAIAKVKVAPAPAAPAKKAAPAPKQKPAPTKKVAAPAKKTAVPAKKAVAVKKPVPAKKAAPAKKVAAKKVVPVKKSAPAKKAVANKAASVKKTAVKKAIPAKKAAAKAPAKKVATKKAPAKKSKR